MKLQSLLIIVMVASCVLPGCHKTQPPITRESLVGSYTYVSEDPESRASDHNLNHLILRLDGTYDLVEGGTTKTMSERKGFWRIEPGSPSNVVDVVLDHAGYPIEIKKTEVRLLIDLDTGIWWVKAK
jgi:hypothetical protein